MTDLIEVKTADLVGEALGWAVGKAEGLDVYLEQPGYNGVPWRVFARYKGQAIEYTKRFNPWEDWALGGPLIEKYRIGFGLYSDSFFAVTGLDDVSGDADGSTHLISACSSIVAAKLGDRVQVPKKLMPYSAPDRSTTDRRLSGSSQVAADSLKEQLTTPSKSPLGVHFSASPPLPWLPLPQNSKPECE